MLNHLLLGQTLTRPNGFWRDPARHDERRESHQAHTRRHAETPAKAVPAQSDDRKGR